ncbi:MAG: pilus assembly protein TadG-related protein [Actinomycetota bacterium]
MRGLMTRLRDERGVSAIIVAITLVLLFGAAALSIDAGSLWKTRRQLITDTDAAALAAARYIATHGVVACQDAWLNGKSSAAFAEANQIYKLNQDSPQDLLDFQFTPLPSDMCVTTPAGHVRVKGQLPAPLTFAPVLGFADSAQVSSSSTAQEGPPGTLVGVRPIALCSANAHYAAWDYFWNKYRRPMTPGDFQSDLALALLDPYSGDHPTVSPPPFNDPYPSSAVVHRVSFGKNAGIGCLAITKGKAVTPGNWGWLDFDPPSGGDKELRGRLENGYSGGVGLPPSECSDGNSGCPPEPGAAGGSTNTALQSIKCDESLTWDKCFSFPVVIYSTVIGSGQNVSYQQVAFAAVVLRGWSWNMTGQASNDFFDFEFVGLVTSEGSIINPQPGGQSDVMLVQLCGVDKTEKCDV